MLEIHIEFLKSQDIVHHNDVDGKEKERKKENFPETFLLLLYQIKISSIHHRKNKWENPSACLLLMRQQKIHLIIFRIILILIH